MSLLCSRARLCEVFDARIGQEDRRQGQHIDFTRLQLRFGLVLVVGNVPVLNDVRAADRRHTDLNMIGNVRLLAEIGDDIGDPDVKAMAAGEDALTLADRVGQLFVLLVVGRGRSDTQQG